MKFAILIFINNMRKKSSLDKQNENIVDLEKDSKTDEYKPKE